MDKPPLRRSGQSVPILFDSFSRCARSGADLLSIESTGGKEVTDHAIMAGDIQGVFYGLGVLGVADMRFLWAEICRISEAAKAIPAGDTACGFGNTAMMLADQRFIPKVFAAVVRAMSAVRSLVAYEEGAQGPGKDCGYENIYLKAITGLPMSLEGRSAAGAHMSSIGNIAGAYADAWSNESIPNIKLLSGMAPVVSMEQLVYDCRLYNVATQRGDALRFRDMMIESDAPLDPQAYLFRPELVVNLCREVIAHTDPLKRMAAAGLTAINQLRTGYAGRAVRIPPKEIPWLDRMHDGLTSALQDGEAFMHRQKEEWREYVAFGEYGLSD
jgi:methanol--5-hydroxybenzimidazolylcobamide Co-methyltransferase